MPGEITGWLRAAAAIGMVTFAANASLAAAPAYDEHELYLLATLSYASASAQAALGREYDAQFRQMRVEIDAREVALQTTIGAAHSAQAQVAKLQREITTLKEMFSDQLAAKDSEFARERGYLTGAGSDLLKTPEGDKALEIFLTHAPGSTKIATDLLERVADKHTAAEFRSRAALGRDGLSHGDGTTEDVLALYLDIAEKDRITWDDLELSKLYANTGHLDSAQDAAEKALTAADNERDRGVSLTALADILTLRNDLVGAQARYNESLEIAQRLATTNPAEFEMQRDVYVSLSRIGQIMLKRADEVNALATYTSALAIAMRLATNSPNPAQSQRDISMALNAIGDILFNRGQFPGALKDYGESLHIRKAVLRSDPTSVSALRDLAIAENDVADVLRQQHKFERAQTAIQQSLETFRKLASIDPNSTEAQRDLSIALADLAAVKIELHATEKALALYNEALSIDQNIVKLVPTSSQAQHDIWEDLHQLATYSIGSNRWRDTVAQIDYLEAHHMADPADATAFAQDRKAAAQETIAQKSDSWPK